MRNNSLPFIEVKQGAWEEYAVRHHSHKELQIGFVERGSSTITCKTLAFEMKADQAILIPPDIIHLCQPHEKSRFKFTILYIDPHWLGTAFRLEVSRLKPQTARLDVKTVETKDRFMASFRSGNDPMVHESETIMFLGDFIFNRFDMQPIRLPVPQGQAEPDQVKAHLDKHFSEQIQLDDLAQLSGMSKFSLLRNFKKQFKLSPHAYLVNKRINHAKELLLGGETVATTAVTCGFFDQSHFVKTFRQYVGIAPIEYKQKK